ncbi:type II toxin-antitoxin system VapC family toxin [candidate division KSB1 bacterium]|nr:type II toxin-antitoxin system VapC family toxin [candidate division KSB1 bacterium]
METRTILLDSSIIIEYFRKENKAKSVLFQLSDKYHFYLSTITIFEIKIGLKSESQWKDYRTLTQDVEILAIDDLCIDEAVKLYHILKEQNKLIELSDLLIAATAISNSLPLATLNRDHFKNIPNIKLLSSNKL